MISKELKKIRLDYHEKMASLNAEKELAEKIEMTRLKTLADKERELKKQTIEANLAINAILRGDGNSSNTTSGCSDTEAESEEESTIEPEIPSIAKEDALNSGSNAPCSSKRKEPPLVIIKRPNEQTEDGPHLPKIKKCQ